MNNLFIWDFNLQNIVSFDLLYNISITSYFKLLIIFFILYPIIINKNLINWNWFKISFYKNIWETLKKKLEKSNLDNLKKILILKILNEIDYLKPKFELYFNMIIYNLNFIILYLIRKSWYLTLLIRLIEINKEKEKYKYRKIFIKWQFLDFFLVKIILVNFFALSLRLIYFCIIFFFNFFFFFLKKYIIKFNILFKLSNIYIYNIYILLIKLIIYNKNIIVKLYTLVYYIQIEIYIYIINENNFIGGLLYYIYNSLAYKIPKFYRLDNWEMHRLYIRKFYKFYNIFWYINNLYIKKYFFNSLNYLYLIFFIKRKSNINNLKKIYKFYKFSFIKKIFLNIGYFIYILVNFIKIFINILINIFIFIFKYIKYVIIIIIIYKISLFYLINIFFYYLINNVLENSIYILIKYLIFLMLDIFNVLNNNFIDNINNQYLFSYWLSNYKNMLINRNIYFSNTLTGKFFKLINLSFNDILDMYEKKSLIVKDISFIKRKWSDYWKNLIKLLFNEIYYFCIIIKDYLIYKLINIHLMCILLLKNINIYYYFFKKILKFFYIILFYTYGYFKFLYFYIIPWYIFDISKIFKLFNIVWKIYFFLKIIKLNIFNFIVFMLYFINILKYILVLFVKYYLIYLYFLIYFIMYFILEYIYKIYNTIIIYNNFIKTYFNIYILKQYYINFFKNIILNYLRIKIINFFNYKHLYSILGNKVKGYIMFDIDVIDMEAIKKYGIKGNEINSLITMVPLKYKFNDYFMYKSKIYIYNNIYYIFNIVYIKDLIYLLIENNIYLLFYFNKYINLYCLELIIIFYILLLLLYNKFFVKKTYKNENLKNLWFFFKKNFKYNLLKKDKFFLKALKFYWKKKKRKFKIDEYYKITENFNLKLIKRKKKLINIINRNLNEIKLGTKLVFKEIVNKNFFIEKYNYYNNYTFFYWKNIILFYNNNNIFFENDKKKEFYNFFLSLIYRKYKLIPTIFFYFNNFSKKYSFNNNYINYYNKVSNNCNIYFNKLYKWLNLNNNWILIKDNTLIIYKKEVEDFSNVYSLNYNLIFPKFNNEYFWIGFIVYLFISKFMWKHCNMFTYSHIYLTWFYIKNILINNNFLYFGNILNYWHNNWFMFDYKNISWEKSNYYLLDLKFVKLYRRFMISNLFLNNNDLLYNLKKNFIYHVRNLNSNYNINFYTIKLFCFLKISNFSFFLISLYIFKKIYIKRENTLLINNNIFLLVNKYILNNIKKNNIKFFYKN